MLKKIVVRMALALTVAFLVTVAVIYVASQRVFAARHAGSIESLPQPSPALVADAPRQLRILGCHACHGGALEGKLMFDEAAVAKVHAPNLTRIAEEATDQQLARAIRQGIGIDGRALFIMPSPAYSRLPDDETAALITAIRAMPETGERTPPIRVGPLGRLGVALGKFRPQTDVVEEYAKRRAPDFGPELAVGRRIAETRCAECHGPALEGATPKPDEPAPDLVVVAAYDAESFRKLMKTGVAIGGRPLGLMGRISRGDLSHLSDDEIDVLFRYLKRRAGSAQ